MPIQIDLSVASHPAIGRILRPVIDHFERESHCTVQFTIQEWDTIWKDLQYIGIYKRGADVSEVGTTWMDSLIAMNALHSFEPSEIARLGGAEAFLPTSWQTTSWQTTSPAEEACVQSIPFLSDVRVIFYWRDMLAQAGVAEEGAFSSFEAMEETLSRLQAVCPTPWAIATDISTHDTLYDAASWVWAVGEDFVSPEARRTQLFAPRLRQALETYFGLHRFMPRELQPMSDGKAMRLFRQRHVAATMGGPWLPGIFLRQEHLAGLAPQLGISLTPGPSFVGGMNLVAWQHTPHPQESIELIRFLVSAEAQIECCPRIGMMPTRLDAFADPYYSDNPHQQVLVAALHKGRVFTRFPLWGMMEERLAIAFAQVWLDIFSKPEPNLSAILARHLDALAQRLDITLGS